MGRGAREGGGVRIIMADLHCCTAETNTTMGKKSNLHLKNRVYVENQKTQENKKNNTKLKPKWED